MSIILIGSIYGALLAYFIGQGEVIEALTGIPKFWASLGFYALFSFLVYVGIKFIKRAELVMSSLILVVIFVIALLTFEHIQLENLAGFDWSKLALPYGVLLFASSGVVAVPEIRLILKRREKLMKKAIFWGCFIPPVIYFLFTALIISVSGIEVTEVATIGLGQAIGWKMILVANIFAFFTMATSFLTLGLALDEMYRFDYKLSKLKSWFLVALVPLIVFLIGARDFVQVLSLVGALGVAILGILEVVTYFVARVRGKRKPEYVIPAWLGYMGGGLVIVLFGLGVVYTISTLI